MNLRILNSQVVTLNLEKLNLETTNDEKIFNLSFANQYDEYNKDVFSVIFDIEVIHPKDFKLKCKYITWFKTSDLIDEAFKISDFPKLNAPAIAFPFLRSLVATITLNSGYSPVLLPSINFISFNQDKIDK